MEKKLLIVSDPLPEGVSVQSDLLSSLIRALKGKYRITAISNHVALPRVEILIKSGAERIISDKDFSIINRIVWKIFRKSGESKLWAISWLLEALLHNNSRALRSAQKKHNFDLTISISSTIPTEAEVWWCQGPPLAITLIEGEMLNDYPKFISKIILKLVNMLDSSMINKMRKMSKNMLVNSKHLREIYGEQGIASEGYLYTIKDLSDFFKEGDNTGEKYVFTYIGKETDLVTLGKLLDGGVKIKAFGGKMGDIGTLSGIISKLDYFSAVSNEHLRKLYSNAHFTAFPFTNEPLGYVPLESMACGTPVLTYDKQGPSETVLDGITGWLVRSQEDFVSKALELWKDLKHSEMSDSCFNRINRLLEENKLQFVERYLISDGRD